MKTLDAPLHKQAQRRIQSDVAYGETKKDLRVWNQVVTENRVAEQVVYPRNKDELELLKVERASDKAQAFKVSYFPFYYAIINIFSLEQNLRNKWQRF